MRALRTVNELPVIVLEKKLIHPPGAILMQPSSIVETPKTGLRSSIDVQMDVVQVRRLVDVKESDSVPIG